MARLSSRLVRTMSPEPNIDALHAPEQPLTEAQIKLISHHTERAARKALKGYVKGALVGFALLAGGMGVAIHQTAGIDTLDARSSNACERLNIVQAQSNVSNTVSFVILSNSGQREAALAAQSSIKKAGTAKIHSTSAAGLFAQADRLAVTDLTDCGLAAGKFYAYPLAGPIGQPRTGDLTKGVKQIVWKSERIIRLGKKKQG